MARATASLIGLVLLAMAGAAAADGWGGIEPGVTTTEQVRERYGAPTRETPRKVEGYDTTEWTYEGPRAPTGLLRMLVEFGLLTPGGFKSNVVRVLRLDPKPFIFAKPTILDGWGLPDRAGRQNEREVFFYDSGLLVTFDPDGMHATSMYFMMPQPAPVGGGAAPTPAPSGAATPTAPRPPAPAPASPPAPARPR